MPLFTEAEILSETNHMARFTKILANTRYAMDVWINEANQHNCCTTYPPALDCPGCRAKLRRWAESNHMTMVMHLLGWEGVLEAYHRSIEIKIEQAKINRSIGSGI